ncbi:MAG TPA: DNA-3-methyladenine glycosylase [Gemmatales bacterium]|nr:DNA-3-methyladenine glycosylase [Gemmatales bacterium]HMP60729.1 DNA-3-methyladenine glycosylase [Gemmatales bacterium]
MDLPFARSGRLHLGRTEPKLKPIMARVGPYRPRMVPNRFEALLRSIVSQQVSVKAAEAIFRKLLATLKGRPPTAAAIARLRPEELRAAGLSGAKARYAHDLAARVADRSVRLDRIHEKADADVIEELTQVHGIGVWTAEMFLIFSLGRPDVLPVDDLGLRAALQRFDGLKELPTKGQVRERGAAWAPYRSVGTWYLWQSLKLESA